jgi:MYXO-CTERM domain-containing protein
LPGRARETANRLLDELELAIDELPEEQREVFVAHELEGRGFKEMAAETGVGVNTLLSRKRYAVLRLRRRLQGVYEGLARGGAGHEKEVGRHRSARDTGTPPGLYINLGLLVLMVLGLVLSLRRRADPPLPQ